MYHTNPYLRKSGILLHFTSRIQALSYISSRKKTSFNAVYTKLETDKRKFHQQTKTSWIVFIGLSIKNSLFPFYIFSI